MTQLREYPPYGGNEQTNISSLKEFEAQPERSHLQLVPELANSTLHKIGEAVLEPSTRQHGCVERQDMFDQAQAKKQTIDSWKNILFGVRAGIARCHDELRAIDEAVQDTGSQRPLQKVGAVEAKIMKYYKEEQDCLDIIALLQEDALALTAASEKFDDEAFKITSSHVLE